MNPPKNLRLTVDPSQAGLRLDRFLAMLEEVGSRGRAAKLIDDGFVLINDRPAKASTALRAGDLVQATIPKLVAPDSLKPLDVALEILHEDNDLLVVNKPAGMVVHPAAGHADDTLVNALIARAGPLSMGFGEHRPGLVHRLDKDTTGLLVIAKNDESQAHLGRQFQERTTHRLYQALVFGEIKAAELTFQSWLARHPTDRKRFASLRSAARKIITDPALEAPGGKWAVTHASVLQRAHGLSFMRLRLETGRTHQIRVHLSESGHPLVGDSTYGGDSRLKSLPSVELRRQIADWPRFFLHARELGFSHPRSGERLRFEVEWPASDLEFLRRWGFRP